MFLEYRVKNFKSIRDEMVLSLVASSDKTNIDTHTIETGIKSIPRLTKSAAIYGANASGKSNLLESLNYFQKVVQQSARLDVEHEFQLEPFAFSEDNIKEPTEFEVTFLIEGVRYQYGFSLTKERIIEEWLLVYKSAKPQTWFTRKFDEKAQEYDYYFGPSFVGLKEVYKQSTRKNALVLSNAILLNNHQLSVVYSWIVNEILFYRAGVNYNHDLSTNMILDEKQRGRLESFLSTADVGISKISHIKRKGRVQEFQMHADGTINSSSEEKEMVVPQFHRKGVERNIPFELHNESLGTQRLYALAGPILDILDSGKLLVFDELDSSLHTLLARMIVNIFNSNSNNKNNAQIIFSTHDTELLNKELLRRDQIWFIEKNQEHGSTLYPLTEFSPRKKEDLEKGYLFGRYGAIPFIDKSIFHEAL